MSLRIALFGSLYRGVAMIETLLELQKRYPEIVIAGIATDDPTQSWTTPQKRVWQYPHAPETEKMVSACALKNNLPVYDGRIKTDDFYERFSSEWMPDLCYMGVFGQKIPERLWSYPLYGFYNFHTCGGETWPSNVGGDPLKKLSAEGKHRASIAMHEVDDEWDHGSLLAFSDFFAIHESEDPFLTQKRSAPYAAQMMSWHIKQTLGVAVSSDEPRYIEQLSVSSTKQLIVGRRASLRVGGLSAGDAGNAGFGEGRAQTAHVRGA